MSAKAEALLHEVLALPDAERAEVVVELLASLDARPEDGDPVEQDRVWAEETERRAQQVVSGAVQAQTWDSVRQRVVDDRLNR